MGWVNIAVISGSVSWTVHSLWVWDFTGQPPSPGADTQSAPANFFSKLQVQVLSELATWFSQDTYDCQQA